MGIGNLLCLWLPWHRWTKLRDLSEQARLYECERCRRRWAMNYVMRCVLPWDTVQDFYRERETRRYGRPIVD